MYLRSCSTIHAAECDSLHIVCTRLLQLFFPKQQILYHGLGFGCGAVVRITQLRCLSMFVMAAVSEVSFIQQRSC